MTSWQNSFEAFGFHFFSFVKSVNFVKKNFATNPEFRHFTRHSKLTACYDK